MMNAHAILIYGAGTANMRIVLHTSTKDGNEHFIRMMIVLHMKLKMVLKHIKLYHVMDSKNILLMKTTNIN